MVRKPPRLRRPPRRPAPFAAVDALRALLSKRTARWARAIFAAADGFEATVRADASRRWIDDKLRYLEAEIEASLRGVGEDFELVAKKIEKRTAAEQKEIFASIRSLDPEKVDKLVKISMRKAPGIGRKIDAFRKTNVAKIRSLGGEAVGRVAKKLREAEDKGWHRDRLRKEIQSVADVSRSKADLLARDQVLKLNGQITEERQTQAGIEEYVWSTSSDERVRPMHDDLDGTTQSWDDPPVTNDAGDTNHPGGDYQCVPGDSEIPFARGVKKTFRRWYSGQLTEIVTDSGKTLRATANHPILTQRGWIPAESIEPGDDVFELIDQSPRLLEEDKNDRVPSIRDVFGAATERGLLQTERATGAELHGDAIPDCDIDIVSTARPLRIGLKASREEGRRKLGLPLPNQLASTLRKLCSVVLAVDAAFRRLVGSLCEPQAFLWAGFGHSLEHRFAPISLADPSTRESVDDRTSGDPESSGDRKYALPSGVGLRDCDVVERDSIPRRAAGTSVSNNPDGAEALAQDVGVSVDGDRNLLQGLPFTHKRSRVIQNRLIDFSGHVFNLETSDGWYVCNSIVVRNCRCVAIPILPKL